MEFSEVARKRRMVRRYDPDRQVPDQVILTVLRNAIRAPSAGFSQGWDFLVLTKPEERQAYWAATADADDDPDPWLEGMRSAPTLILCLSDEGTYLRRYAEPDKGWTDMDEARWPVPYWDIDTGMAALMMLLTGVDEGLGGCFFGAPPETHEDVFEAFGIPHDRNLVGVVSLGYPVPHAKSGSLKRGLRGLDQIAHFGRFGRHTAVKKPPTGS
ncbi:MAG TPA: nitroreductase family protein [Dermatophilaceae bacterium]|jgi:nitroreductase